MSVAVAIAILASACSGQGGIGNSSMGSVPGVSSIGLATNPYMQDFIGPNIHRYFHLVLGKDKNGRAHRDVNSSNFTWVAVFGDTDANAEADCPSTWKVIGGGTNTSNVTFVGIGHYNSDKTGWIAPATSGGKSEAFASCVAPTTYSDYFEWVATSGSGGATVTCDSGYDLVMGYGSTATGHVGVEYPVYGSGAGKNEFVLDGSSSGTVTAHASCVRDSEAVIVHDVWGDGSSIAACPETGSLPYIIIGGSMGNGDYPGPPLEEYPTGTGSGNNNEWHTFNFNWPNSTTPVLAHAVCAPVTST
jgi:hypothetical protein